MVEIRYAENTDKDFWFTLDKHLDETEFENKIYQIEKMHKSKKSKH